MSPPISRESWQAAQPAVYRATDAQPWADVEIVGRHRASGGLILREVDKLWPGVFCAPLGQVRIAGRIFELREPCGRPLRKAA